MSDTPILTRKRPANSALSAWTLRLLLALCLFFSAELVFLTDVQRPLWLWLPVSVGYVALAALMLHIMVIWTVRELFGALVLLGGWSLFASALLNPQIVLERLPVTLVSRGLGVQFLAASLGLALFAALMRSTAGTRWLWAGVAVGVYWGLWGRLYPLLLADLTPPLAPLIRGILAGALVLFLLMARWGVARGAALHPSDLRLGRVSLWAVLGVLVLLMAWRLGVGHLPREGLSLIITLLAFCGVVLWFQKRTQQPTSLLDVWLPFGSGGDFWAILGGGAFVGVGLLVYVGVPPLTPLLELLSLTFGFLGLTWLPTVSAILGIRGYRYHTRTGKTL